MRNSRSNNQSNLHAYLGQTLKEFLQWQGLNPDQYLFGFDEEAADWIMKPQGSTIVFNTYLLKTCSVEFFILVITHEFFHTRQGLYRKEDVKIMKNSWAAADMRRFDIEADVVAAQFLKEARGYSEEDYFLLYATGRKYFREVELISGKFERFLGSLLSTYYLYDTSRRVVLSPSIDDYSLENKLSFQIFGDKDYMRYARISVETNVFNSLKNAWQPQIGDSESFLRMTKHAYVSISREIRHQQIH